MTLITVFGSRTIENLKAKPTNEYPKILKNSKENVYSNILISEYTPLKKLGEYRSIDTGFEREMLWSCNLLAQYSDALNSFLDKRNEYENQVLNKDFESATSTLDDIERVHGYSIWLIEAKIALLQNKDGLDAQKNFLSFLYDTRDSGNYFDLVYYISFLISQRNEPHVKTQALIDIIKKQLKVDSEQHDIYIKYWLTIRYVILGEDIYNKKDASYLMAYLQTVSIYDLLDFVVQYFIVLSFDKHSLDEKKLNLYIKLLSSIKDYRLDNVKHFGDYNINTPPSLLISGNDFLKYAETEKDKLFFELACYREEISKEPSHPSLISDFCFKIRDIFIASKSMLESIEWVKKTRLNNKHIRFISAMNEVMSIVQDKNESSIKEKYLSLISSHKNLINYIDKDEFFYNRAIPLIDKTEHFFINDVNTLINDIYFNSGHFKNTPSTILKSTLLPKKIFFYQFMTDKLIEQKEYSEAFKLASTAYLENYNYILFLPINEMVKNRKWSFYSSLDNHADAAIIISGYLKNNDDEKQRFNLKACCKKFIDDAGVKFHCELDERAFDGSQSRLIEFLSNVCTPQTLELDTNRYPNARSVLEQRIKVCEKIISILRNEKIEAELKDIQRKIAVSDGLKTTDTRGVTVDYNGFCSVAEQKIKDNFNRYIAFIEAGIDVDSNYNIKEKSSVNYNPIEESDIIILSILGELSKIFLSHHEYGLDYYLSMRIRHGRFIGILRGPLEQRKLITKFSNDIDSYVENSFWGDVYQSYISPDNMIKLQGLLTTFSYNFDTMIKEFTDSFIQIRSEKKPNGMYYLSISNQIIELAKNNIKENKNFDIFLKEMFDIFFLLIEGRSEELQNKIKSWLKIEIRNLIIELQQHASFLKNTPHLDLNIHDELNRVRTDIDGSINNIINWFETSTYEKQDIRLYTFEELIDIGLARTKQTRALFNPKIATTLEAKPLDKLCFISNVVATFSDIFSILFDNIYDHSEMGNNVEILIDAKVLEIKDGSAFFYLNVRNKSIVTPEKISIISKIKEDIKSHNIRSRQEGHSGYHKLCAIPMVKDVDDLDFGFDNDYFYTSMILTLDLS